MWLHVYFHYQVDNFKLKSIRHNIDFDTLQKGYEQHVLAKTTNWFTHSCIHLDGNIIFLGGKMETKDFENLFEQTHIITIWRFDVIALNAEVESNSLVVEMKLLGKVVEWYQIMFGIMFKKMTM
jgi:hypothetical protein